jgi:hypothetical protein
MSSSRARPRHQGVPAATRRAQEKLPLAFPVNDQDVRPLAIDATDEIAVAKGWSLPYTLGLPLRYPQRAIVLAAVRPSARWRSRTATLVGGAADAGASCQSHNGGSADGAELALHPVGGCADVYGLFP